MSAVGSPQQGFPRLDTPFITNEGTISREWARLLIQLFKLAGTNIPLAQGVYLKLDGTGVFAYDTENNLIGQVAIGSGPSGTLYEILWNEVVVSNAAHTLNFTGNAIVSVLDDGDGNITAEIAVPAGFSANVMAKVSLGF